MSAGRAEKICQIAFTAAGLRALGVDSDVVNRFSPEFVEGMAGNDNRSLRLGDIEANEPKQWNWGFGDREPHVLLMLFSAPDEIETFANWMLSDALAAGLSRVEVLSDSDMDDFEPFGFKDGVSQPSFDWDRPRTPGTKADQDYTNLIALGELLLGYRNEYGLLTERPWLKASEKNAGMLPPTAQKDRHDLGRNGSYLIYRQLAQDVRGFWRWVADEAARCGIEKGGTGRVDGRAQARRQPARRSHTRSLHPGRQRAPRGQQCLCVRHRSGGAELPDRRAMSGAPIRAPATCRAGARDRWTPC